jgi:hypothetical protein
VDTSADRSPGCLFEIANVSWTESRAEQSRPGTVTATEIGPGIGPGPRINGEQRARIGWRDETEADADADAGDTRAMSVVTVVVVVVVAVVVAVDIDTGIVVVAAAVVACTRKESEKTDDVDGQGRPKRQTKNERARFSTALGCCDRA